MKKINKIWGKEEWLICTPFYWAKYLYINKNSSTSYQYHNIKHKTMIVLEGALYIEIEGKIERLTEGAKVIISPLKKHRAFAKDTNVKILEVSTQHKEEDIVRLRKGYTIKELQEEYPFSHKTSKTSLASLHFRDHNMNKNNHK